MFVVPIGIYSVEVCENADIMQNAQRGKIVSLRKDVSIIR